MHILELLLIAAGLSMDAFAVAVCLGMAMPAVTIKKALIVGLYFGAFQAAMPFIGYTLGARFADKITTIDHWIAFLLLCFIGGKMIWESRKKDDDTAMPQRTAAGPGGETRDDTEPALTPGQMLPPALATSIDALAVGVSFAFLKVDILSAASSIGLTTLVFSMAGVKIGNLFGARFKSRAELAGGVILVLMGCKILFEHF